MPMPPLWPDPSKNAVTSLLLATTSSLASSLESGIQTMKLSISFGPAVHGFIDLKSAGQTLKACITSCSGAQCDLMYLFATWVICFTKGWDHGRVASLVTALCVSLFNQQVNVMI